MNDAKIRKFRVCDQICVVTPNGLAWRAIASDDERKTTPGIDFVFNKERLAEMEYTGGGLDPRWRKLARKTRPSRNGGRS